MNTEIVKVDACNIEGFAGKLSEAARIIKSGGLVVFPTETVYGLGADATNASAAKKIYEAKGRPSDNPLIIHISEPHEAEKYTYTNKLYYKLAEVFMPGPLTVILPAKESIPPETRASLPTVAVRCPENKIARKLIELSGVPIAAPSANLSGSPSPTSASHVIDDMNGRVDMIIDGGDSDFGLESTIVKIGDDNTLILLRPGKVTPEQLALFAPVTIAASVVDKLADGEVALSPGMKYRHYAPKAPLILIEGSTTKLCDFLSCEKNTAVICYDEDTEVIKSSLPDTDIYPIGRSDEEVSHAHNLFRILREADKKNYDKIYAPLPNKSGIGLALYNRMIRAAAHRIIKL